MWRYIAKANAIRDETPAIVCRVPERVRNTTRDPAILEGLDFRREGPTRKLPASLIQQNPETPLGEFIHFFRETSAGFDEVDFEF